MESVTKMKMLGKGKKRKGDTKVEMGDKQDNDWEVLSSKLSRAFKLHYLIKLVIVEVILYLILYYTINLVYRLALDEEQQKEFSKVARYFDDSLYAFSRDITFLLGFYVSIVAKRWWDQYRMLPWPDNLALTLTSFVTTKGEKNKTLRESIIRYALLSYVLCIRRFSSNLQRKLPNMKSLIDIGLLKVHEIRRLRVSDIEVPKGNESDSDDDEDQTPQELLESNWWMPLSWCASLVKYGKINGHIPSDGKDIMNQLMRFRKDLESVESHVHVSIPLVYKLVVKSAIYIYFTLTLIGAQTIGLPGEPYDMYFPLFTIFKLVLFIGWLKVAQSIEKPFGEDDADFQMHSLLTRHMRTTQAILDEFDNVPNPFDEDFYPPPKEEDEESGKKKGKITRDLI